MSTHFLYIVHDFIISLIFLLFRQKDCSWLLLFCRKHCIRLTLLVIFFVILDNEETGQSRTAASRQDMIAMNLYSGIMLFFCLFVFCNDFEQPVRSEVISTMIKISFQSSGSYFWTVMVCAWCCLCSHVSFFLCGYTIPFEIFIQHCKILMQFGTQVPSEYENKLIELKYRT